MASKLYVGGLPYSTTDQELQDIFTPFGAVDSAVIINDKMSGRSKGFGFVEMSSKEEAEAAIKSLDGSEVGGRKIIVNEARPREDRPRDGGGYRPSNGGSFRQRDDRDSSFRR